MGDPVAVTTETDRELIERILPMHPDRLTDGEIKRAISAIDRRLGTHMPPMKRRVLEDKLTAIEAVRDERKTRR